MDLLDSEAEPRDPEKENFLIEKKYYLDKNFILKDYILCND